jgi:hypothetical protein
VRRAEDLDELDVGLGREDGGLFLFWRKENAIERERGWERGKERGGEGEKRERE